MDQGTLTIVLGICLFLAVTTQLFHISKMIGFQNGVLARVRKVLQKDEDDRDEWRREVNLHIEGLIEQLGLQVDGLEKKRKQLQVAANRQPKGAEAAPQRPYHDLAGYLAGVGKNWPVDPEFEARFRG